MIIDVHVHTCTTAPGHGKTSRRLLDSLGFRFMRWRLGVGRLGPGIDDRLAAKLSRTVAESGLDAAVLLAFDAVHRDDGSVDDANTHLYVTNDDALALCRRDPRLLFGCSVHPYRKDALAELERCVAAGAVLMKWLPLTQRIDPADPRCFPLYEAMAHHGLPLLSHTGFENALPTLDARVADPALLTEALRRGVTVIAAHCGTRSKPGERDYLPDFMRMAREHERLYGDTAALCLPTRSYAFKPILADPVVRSKLVHGSDWPIYCMPPAGLLGLRSAFELWRREPNWMRRDVLCKQRLGFDEAYWRRASTLLRLPRRATPP